MKYLPKTVLLVVIGLLAAQPVLSSLSCAAGMAACIPACPMAMSGMVPDCPMPGTMVAGMSAAEGCPQNCCTQNAVNAVLPKSAPDKSKVSIANQVAALTSIYAAPGIEKPAVELLEARADTMPRYILNHVFRI
jgi:hypothetical protein